MAIIIDRTGLEITAGPLQFHLTGAMVGFAWDGRIDAMLERTDYRPAGGRWFESWKTAPGWYEAYALGCRISVQFGNGWRTAAA